MNIEIADRLVKLRKEHNLSQEALASKLGLSRQAVSKWERAEASPDTDNLVALAELYGVPLDEILNGPKAQEEDTPNNEPTKAELKEKKLADMSERQRVGRKMVKFPVSDFNCRSISASRLYERKLASRLDNTAAYTCLLLRRRCSLLPNQKGNASHYADTSCIGRGVPALWLYRGNVASAMAYFPYNSAVLLDHQRVLQRKEK